MQRTAVNPWPWSRQYGYNQAELIAGPERVLYCSGQTAISSEGKPLHAGDMRGQITLALDNLDAVLRAANMTFANVVRLVTYTTDIDSCLACHDLLGSKLRAAGVTPAQTMLGVNRLFLPSLMYEIEAIAVG